MGIGVEEVPFELFLFLFGCALYCTCAPPSQRRAAPEPHPGSRYCTTPVTTSPVCSGAHMYERGLVQGSTITRIASWAQAEKSKIPMFRLRVSAGSLPVLRAISSGGLYL